MSARIIEGVLRRSSGAVRVALAGALGGVLCAAVDLLDALRHAGPRSLMVVGTFGVGAGLLATVGAVGGGVFGGLVPVIRTAALRANYRLLWRSFDARVFAGALLFFAAQGPALVWLWDRPSLSSALAKALGVLGVTAVAVGLGALGAVAWEGAPARARLAAILGMSSAIALFMLAEHPYVRPHHPLSLAATALGVLAFADMVGPSLSRRLTVRRCAALVLAVVVFAVTIAFFALDRSRVRQTIASEMRAGPELVALGRRFRLWSPSAIDILAARTGDAPPKVSKLASPGAGIVWITVDSLRANRLGAYGSSRGLTPNIDHFMETAVVFEKAYAQFPSTTGSLPSLHTGTFPWDPIEGWRRTLAERHPLAKRLRNHGYQTAAYFGSWNLLDAQGFFTVDKNRLGFDGGSSSMGGARGRVSAALDFLKHATRPFVWVHIMEPHEPYSPHDDLANGPRDPYDNEVAFVDATLRPLLDFIEQRTDLVVWFTADHGEAFGEHGDYFHASSLYEEQIRVPLAVRAPGLSPRRANGPFQLLDIMPTTLALVGLDEKGFDGRDRRSELEGGRNSSPAFAIFEDQVMVATSDAKLACKAASDTCVMYDLNADPEERSSIYGLGNEQEQPLRNTLMRFVAGDRGLVPGRRTTLERLLLMRRALQHQAGTPAALDSLLRSSDPVERQAASENLARMPEVAAAEREALIRARRDDVDGVRFWATVALARIGDEAARRELGGLEPGNGEPSALPWLVLARYEGDAATSPSELQKSLLEHMDLSLAKAVIKRAKELKDVRWRSDFVRWLENADLAEAAADALIEIDPPGAVGDIARAVTGRVPPDAQQSLSRVLARARDPSAAESLLALARSTDDWAVFGEAALAVHVLGHDLAGIASVASTFTYSPDRGVYRATLRSLPIHEGWVDCWVGVKNPRDELPRITVRINGEMIGEDDPSVPALRMNFPAALLQTGDNTVDIAVRGAEFPVRGVVIAPPKRTAPRAEAPPSVPSAAAR
jgi:arylsulfatase A-like enzyme